MTGGTFHQDSIEASWRKVSFPYRSMCPQLKKQAAFAAFFAVALLGFNEPFTAEIVKSSPYRRFRQLKIARYRRYRRPAFAVLVCAVEEVNVHRNGTVRKVGAV